MGARVDAAPRRADVRFADEMPARLRERLAAMSPERRQALWARIDNALASSDESTRRPARETPRRSDR
jgi:hypothetical protein